MAENNVQVTTTGKYLGNITFVGYVPGSKATTTTTRSVPKRAHKKSKTGCQRCRARKIKCNEEHPICEGCKRHKIACVYDHRPTPATTRQVSTDEASDPTHYSMTTNKAPVDPLQECKERRYLEIKLMQQWTTKTALTFLGSAKQHCKDLMTINIPMLALEHDSLLFVICSFSALHIAMTTDDSTEKADAMDKYRGYLKLALQEHQNDIADLGSHNADVVCVTSVLLIGCTLAILQERLIEPYVPPSEWLKVTKGMVEDFKRAWGLIDHSKFSIAKMIINRNPDLLEPSDLMQESNGFSLKHLLRRTYAEIQDEPWNVEIEHAYKSAICYIGGMRIAFESGDATADELSRIAVGFPLMVNKVFIDLVEQEKERALYIMAHYFALVGKLRRIWWFGDVGWRELRAIVYTLPEKWIWIEMMAYPIKIVKEEPIQTEPINL